MVTQKAIRHSILHYCEKTNISQKELAEQIGVRRQSLNDWVRGKTSPTIKNLEKLQNIIGELKDE